MEVFSFQYCNVVWTLYQLQEIPLEIFYVENKKNFSVKYHNFIEFSYK